MELPYSFKNNLGEVEGHFLGVEDEEDPVQPAHEEQSEPPVVLFVCVPWKSLRYVVQQNFCNVTWEFVDDSIVPMGIANVSFLEIVFLGDEGSPSIRSVGDI